MAATLLKSSQLGSLCHFVNMLHLGYHVKRAKQVFPLFPDSYVVTRQFFIRSDQTLGLVYKCIKWDLNCLSYYFVLVQMHL